MRFDVAFAVPDEIPSLEEQRRIGEPLDRLETLRTERDRKPTALSNAIAATL